MFAASRFAEHALGTRFADLPPAAVERAKVFMLDSLGVGIAGSSVEGGDELLKVAGGWGAPTPSSPPVLVWGQEISLPAPSAVFMNAWQMHNQEYDGLHEGAVVHAMASVLPAALAAAELAGGATGAELITAITVGVDIAAGLGLASRSGFRFFRPATAGGFGATAAAARLLGLDRPALERAFAWQLAQASGTMQAHVEGSPILPAQVAFNARAALQSCTLAALPFTAAEGCSRATTATCGCSKASSRSSRSCKASGATGASPSSATSLFPPGAPRTAASRECPLCARDTASPRSRSPPSRSPPRR
jgi:2-methylcitrate dehydratase PrpD